MRLFFAGLLLCSLLGCGSSGSDAAKPRDCRPWGENAARQVDQGVNDLAYRDTAVRVHNQFWQTYASRFAQPATFTSGRYEWDGTVWRRTGGVTEPTLSQYVIEGVGDIRFKLPERSLSVTTSQFVFSLSPGSNRLPWHFSLNGAWQAGEIVTPDYWWKTPVTRFAHTQDLRSYDVDLPGFRLQAAFGATDRETFAWVKFNGDEFRSTLEANEAQCPGQEDEIAALVPKPEHYVNVGTPLDVLERAIENCDRYNPKVCNW